MQEIIYLIAKLKFSFKQIEKFIADMESESDNLQSFEDWENYIKHIKVENKAYYSIFDSRIL